jgi:scyllo-inositol 2-dehydrogenase (NADP+)
LKNIVLIGCGNITNTKHIPALSNCLRQNFRISGVVGLTKESVNRTKKIGKISQGWVGDLQIETPPIWVKDADFFVIGTPPHTHASIVTSLLKLNPKCQIITEKPLSISTKECEDFFNFENWEKRIFVMHNFQFSKSFLKMRDEIAKGKIGTIKSVRALQWSSDSRRLPLWKDELPLGLFWDESAHFYYLLYNLCGDYEVLSSTAFLRKGLVTPSVMQISMLAGKVPLEISIAFDASISEWGVTVSGSNGTLIMDMFRDTLTYLPHDGEHYARDILRTTLKFIYGSASGFLVSGVRLLTKRLHWGMDVAFQLILRDIDEPDRERLTVKSGLGIIKKMETTIKLTKVVEI